jgi:ureidoacrylate peracid hydrolase
VSDVANLVQVGQCALLVIDMQKDFCDPRFARRDVSMTSAMIPTLQELIASARRAEVAVIHIRTEHTEATDSDVSISAPRWDGQITTPLARPGTPGAEFMDGLTPLSDETVITKRRYSGFVGTDLELALRSQGIRTIVTTGVQTNNCVEATARDGMMRDFFVVLVSDATATYDESLHQATLTTIANHYGDVVSASDIVSIWERQQAGRS